jgi:hypothetical protein
MGLRVYRSSVFLRQKVLTQRFTLVPIAVPRSADDFACVGDAHFQRLMCSSRRAAIARRLISVRSTLKLSLRGKDAINRFDRPIRYPKIKMA